MPINSEFATFAGIASMTSTLKEPAGPKAVVEVNDKQE
jgi:hypothetical protein